jgi:hypothetical protein
MEDAVVPSHLIARPASSCRRDGELCERRTARQVPAASIAVLRGIKRELLATSELGPVERGIGVVAANQCRHAANATIAPQC